MTTEEFQDFLSLYGSDLSTWPDDIRRAAEAVIAADPSMNSLIASEKVFEEIAAARRVPADDGFAARVVAASAHKASRKGRPGCTGGLAGFLYDLRQMLPAPVPSCAVLSCAVLVGFALGWLAQTDSSSETVLQSVLYLTGGIV